jgi:glutamate synthase domain-containing protein 3
MTTIAEASKPIEGYLQVSPEVRIEGGVATIDARGIYYKHLNAAIRQCFAEGVPKVVLRNINGQRYIGTGIRGADKHIEVHGTAGQDMAMFMDGPTVEVFGNAQDGVGNTMNAGRVVVHGDAGDVLGYGMRGGRIFIKGDVGYRVGIHMKAYESHVPVMVCGGKSRDFFGEYMAGGMLVLLGMDTRIDGPLVGGYVGTGMHGGTIYLRGEVEPWQCGKEVGVFTADEEDMKTLRPVLEEYCEAFGADIDEVLCVSFTKLVAISHRPYGKLYTYV